MNVLMTAGSILRGDDAAGPYLARLLEERPVPGWEVIDGGQTPEDDLPVVRRLAPDFLVLVDAASMGGAPGEIRELHRADVMTDYLMTTHSLPLTFLLDNLANYCGRVLFLGIQAAQTELLAPLSPPVLAAVEEIEAWIRDGADLARIPAGAAGAAGSGGGRGARDASGSDGRGARDASGSA